MMPDNFDEVQKTVQEKVDEFTQNMKYGWMESKIMGGWSQEAIELQVQFKVLEENLINLEENLINLETKVRELDNDFVIFTNVNVLSNEDLNEINKIKTFEEQYRTSEKIGKDKDSRKELTCQIMTYNKSIATILRKLARCKARIEIGIEIISKLEAFHGLIERYKKAQDLIDTCMEQKLEITERAKSFIGITSYCKNSLNYYESSCICISFLNKNFTKKPKIIGKYFNNIKSYEYDFNYCIVDCTRVVNLNKEAIRLLEAKEAERLEDERKKKNLLHEFFTLLEEVKRLYDQIKEEGTNIADKYEEEYNRLIDKEEPSSSDLNPLNWLFNAFNGILNLEVVSNIQLVSISSVDESEESNCVILPLCYNRNTESLLGELMKEYDGIIKDTEKYQQEYGHQSGGLPMKNKMIHVHCSTKDGKGGKSGGIGIYYKSFKIEGVEYIRPIIVDVAGERPGKNAKKGKNQYYWELSGTDYEPSEGIIETKYLNDDLNEEEESFRR